jgi:predicted secreted protein
MSQGFPKKINPYHLLILAEIKTLCGQPPVLSTESTEAYNTMLLRLIESIGPKDFVERLFCKHIADCTWEIIRYTRHKMLLMERRHRQALDSRAQQLKAAAQKKQAGPADGKTGCETPTDAMRASLKEIEAVMLQSPTEFDHADALERGIDYAERLDKLLNAATARRDDVLRQLERYRDGLSARLCGSTEVTDYDPAHPHWIEDHEILDPVVPKKIQTYDPPPEMPQIQMPGDETPPNSASKDGETPPPPPGG